MNYIIYLYQLYNIFLYINLLIIIVKMKQILHIILLFAKNFLGIIFCNYRNIYKIYHFNKIIYKFNYQFIN